MPKVSFLALRLMLALGLTIAELSPAFAMKVGETYDQWLSRQSDEATWESQRRQAKFFDLVKGLAESYVQTGFSGSGMNTGFPSQQAATFEIRKPRLMTFQLTNVATSLQPGEPTENNLMTRTIWGRFKPPGPARIVVHTFGSEINTVLAAYRGDTSLSTLTRLAGNDNTPLAGFGSTSSLIQFNVAANTDYSIQIGSRANAEGDILANVFVFPPTGGLGAFLAEYGGSKINGRDYICEIFTVGSLQCPSAKFILYNATDKTLTVTPSTTLGAGVTSVAAFSLVAKALKVVEFKFGSGFSHAQRTQSGNFVFTGRVGSSVITKTEIPATVIVRPTATVEDLVRARVGPTIQTGFLNASIAFTARLTNTGSVTAIGCHFRSTLGSDLHSSFYEINPANGARLGVDNKPVNLAAGQTRTFKVTVVSQTARDADHIDPEVVGDCANNHRRVQALRGDIDVTTSGYSTHLPALVVTSKTPDGDALIVPASGYAYYKFQIKNMQLPEPLNVLPGYVGPFDDPANTKYSVAICRTNVSTGACIGAYASSVSYTPTKGTIFGFSVRVKAPTGSPAYDPDKRRVFVNFKMSDAPYYHIAAPSFAVKKQ